MTKSMMVSLIALVLLVQAGPMVLAAPVPGVVNVNTAGSDELQLLPRIGPKMAGRFLEYRRQKGPFKAVEELLEIKGIGEKTLERLRPYLVLQGKTTLSQKIPSPRKKSQ